MWTASLSFLGRRAPTVRFCRAAVARHSARATRRPRAATRSGRHHRRWRGGTGIRGYPAARGGRCRDAHPVRRVVVLEFAAILLLEEGDAAMRLRLAQMLSSETKRRGMVLVFLEAPEAERHLPSIVSDQFVRLHVPYPRAEELDSLTD